MAKASPMPAAPSRPSRRSSNRAARCCCARASARASRKQEKLPCSLKIEIQTPRGLITAPVYEISIDGILISGADAEKLPPNQSLDATLQDIGACKIRVSERSKAGAQAQFERPDAALREAIEDKLWAIHDENTEFVTRAMEAGAALTKIFEQGVASGAISMEDMFDTNYVEIPGSNPVQYRTKILDWADRALPPFQEAFLAKDKRMAFCAMIDQQRLSAGSQQDLFASAAAGRRHLEHRQQPQPPHLQRSRGPRRRPQPARLSGAELRPRHGQRQHRDDARDRRADPRQGPALGRLPHGLQAVDALREFTIKRIFARKRSQFALRQDAKARIAF